MPVAAIGGPHGAAMGAAEKLRGGQTWGPGGGRCGSRAGGLWRAVVGGGLRSSAVPRGLQVFGEWRQLRTA